MKRYIKPIWYLFICGALTASLSLAGCNKEPEAPATSPGSAQSGATPNATPTLPPEVQVGPPK